MLDEEVGLTTMRAPAVGSRADTPPAGARRRFPGRGRSTGDPGTHRLPRAGVRGRTSATWAGFGRASRSGCGWMLCPSAPSPEWSASVGQLPLDSGPSVQLSGPGLGRQPDGLLRPQMAAHARVLTEPREHLHRLLRAPARWLTIVLVENMGLRTWHSCSGRDSGLQRPARSRAGSATETGGSRCSLGRLDRFRRHLDGQVHWRFPPSSTWSTMPRSTPDRLAWSSRSRWTSAAGFPPASRWLGWKAPTSGSHWHRPRRSLPTPSSRSSGSGR